MPATLTGDQNELVAAVAETIIPETDTGGARAAGVNEFIDKMLTDWFMDDERQRFLAALDEFRSSVVAEHGEAYEDLESDAQIRVLEGLEADRKRWREAVSRGEAAPDAPPFFEMMRELTIAGYYTSEVGASQELKYEIIFSSYEGDVPYDEIGRAWS